MSCPEIEARMIDAVDGRLDAALEMRFHAHLESCALCRERAALWRALTPQLRALAPPPPDAMHARRLQIETERRLRPAPAPARRSRPRRVWVPAALSLVGAAAALALWLRPAPTRPGAARDGSPAFAVVTRLRGRLSTRGQALATAAHLAPGSELALPDGAETELALEGGATLRLWGPARLTLGGDARAVALRLDDGTLEAVVAHRAAGETFAVITEGARVEVRGTRFVVGAGSAAGGRPSSPASWVRVVEGRVAVRFASGETRLVGAGETATAAPLEPVPDLAPVTGAELPAPPSCARAVRSCQGAAQSARESMRGGDHERALHLVTLASREARQAHPPCPDRMAACEDELGYLRAEALRGAGRLPAAVAAYKALDRRGAPAAMRQNALYAAAELERRQGQIDLARGDYEGALAAAPRGALRQEALLGSMESAEATGDHQRACELARRYLAESRHGMGAAAARRLLGDGAQVDGAGR